MIEIERKFLVKSEAFVEAAKSKMRIRQGFLSSVPERTVRVRLTEEKGYLTVKGLGNAQGTARFEWEKTLGIAEAELLYELTEAGRIDKTRYEVDYGKHTFEVDVFHGENEGLILAELELSFEDESYSKPDWLGEEVTGQTPYYNASLSKHPYKKWSPK